MPPLRILLFGIVATLLVATIQLGALKIVFDKLGLAHQPVIWPLMLTLLGSMVNLPLLTLKAKAPVNEEIFQHLPERLLRELPMLPGKTLVAVNIGGCLLPVAFSLYLFLDTPLDSENVVAAIVLVALIAYYSSALLPGIGIVMPMLAAPLAAAFIGANLDAAHAAPLAYISGTLGVLLGADLLRIREIGQIGEPVVAIGGAGTFDGIFLTGILAVLIT